jgi:hypothetical protein
MSERLPNVDAKDVFAFCKERDSYFRGEKR